MRQIKKYSGILQKTFYSLTLLYPLATVILWSLYSKLPERMQWQISPVNPEIVFWNSKTFVFVIFALVPSLILSSLIFWTLSKIFAAFTKGRVFDLQNCKNISLIAKYLCYSVGFDIVSHLLMSYALTFQNSIGSRMINLTINSEQLTTLLMALIVYVLSMIQEEASRLSEESRLTV